MHTATYICSHLTFLLYVAQTKTSYGKHMESSILAYLCDLVLLIPPRTTAMGLPFIGTKFNTPHGVVSSEAWIA